MNDPAPTPEELAAVLAVLLVSAARPPAPPEPGPERVPPTPHRPGVAVRGRRAWRQSAWR